MWLIRLWFFKNKTLPQYKVKRFKVNVSPFILNFRDPQLPSSYASGILWNVHPKPHLLYNHWKGVQCKCFYWRWSIHGIQLLILWEWHVLFSCVCVCVCVCVHVHGVMKWKCQCKTWCPASKTGSVLTCLGVINIYFNDVTQSRKEV